MAVEGGAPAVTGAGEYGATTVQLSKDGHTLRVAFGRNGEMGAKVFYGAVLLSPEAANELKEQLARVNL